MTYLGYREFDIDCTEDEENAEICDGTQNSNEESSDPDDSTVYQDDNP